MDSQSTDLLARYKSAFPFLSHCETIECAVDFLNDEMIDRDYDLSLLRPEHLDQELFSTTELMYYFATANESGTEENKIMIRAIFDVLKSSHDELEEAFNHEHFVYCPIKFELAATEPSVTDEIIISSFCVSRPPDIDEHMFDVFGPERKAALISKLIDQEFLFPWRVYDNVMNQLMPFLTLEKVKDLIAKGVDPKKFNVNMMTHDGDLIEFLLKKNLLILACKSDNFTGVPSIKMTDEKLEWIADNHPEFFEWEYATYLFPSPDVPREVYLKTVKFFIERAGFSGDHFDCNSREERVLRSMIDFVEGSSLMIFDKYHGTRLQSVSMIKFMRNLADCYGIHYLESLGQLCA